MTDLEDKKDLEELNKMRKGRLEFRKFTDFLAGHNNGL